MQTWLDNINPIISELLEDTPFQMEVSSHHGYLIVIVSHNDKKISRIEKHKHLEDWTDLENFQDAALLIADTCMRKIVQEFKDLIESLQEVYIDARLFQKVVALVENKV